MIKILERSHDDVFGFEMSEDVSLDDIRRAEVGLNEAIEKYGKISWLVVMKTFKYTSLRAMYEDMMWLLKHLKHFDRMVVVGDKTWQELMIKADSLFFGEKYFDISRLDEAWDYVEGKT